MTLAAMRILVTAGPTREYLDDVRYLSNDSSGRMGYALAESARMRGTTSSSSAARFTCSLLRAANAST